MNVNSQSRLADNKAKWLDKALAEQPAAVKARVLDFAIRFGVESDDDDFWVLIAAVGYLNTIVEDAPKQWNKTLSTHTEELNQWTESNLQLIKSLTLQAETGAQQAELLTELSSTLSTLTQRLNEQQQHIKRLQIIYSTSEQTLNNMHAGLNHRLNELSRQIENRPAISNSLQSASGKGNRLSKADNTGLVITAVVTAVLMGLLWLGQHRQTNMLRQLINQPTGRQNAPL